MKKIFSFVIALLPIVATAQDRIMLIADPHVFPQTEIAQTSGFDTYMAQQRKMVDLSEPIWHALLDTALAYHPSLVLIPGDLTRDGEQAAHDTVAAGINRLQEAGIRTLVIPGNHDMAGSNWETLYPGTYENAAIDAQSHSFAVSPLQGLTVIGIDGSNGNAGTGVISAATRAFILAQADSAVAKGHTVIAMSHWQLIEHFDQKATLESSCRMQNADALRDSLMAHGVHLVLTGHFHVNSVSTYRDTTGVTNDSIVEISTGSPITYPCPYRWLTLSQDRASMNVETAYLTSVDTIADLYTYSREWMAEHTANMIPAIALRAWGKLDSKWDSDIVPMMQKAGLSSITINYIKNYMIPNTDEERIDITQRHLGDAAVNLYLFHSDGNEFERPDMAQSLAEAVYTGMEGMMNECFGLLSELVGALKRMARQAAQEPVQSLVEDKTMWASALHSDVTDDLHPSLVLNEPQVFTDLYEAEDAVIPCRKFILNGELFIEHNGQFYNIQGQRIR